ncbi:MAG: hypothetical protein IPL61_31295 [Myxococcales bacterium]|nr:hypothetical protein [Myxococcales bacterium]
MKLALIGGVPEAQLVAALARARPGTYEPAERNTLAWVDLADAPRKAIAAVQAALGARLTVIEVELPLGGRGAGLCARRYTVPATEERDLSDEMTKLLASWLATVSDDPGAPFDEEVAALDLALVCAEDVRPPPPPPAIPMGGGAMPLKRKGAAKPTLNPLHEQWASALVDALRASERLDTTGEALPLRRIAALLEAHDQVGTLAPALGDALLELLVDHEAVEEVFADEAELVAAAQAARPR